LRSSAIYRYHHDKRFKEKNAENPCALAFYIFFRVCSGLAYPAIKAMTGGLLSIRLFFAQTHAHISDGNALYRAGP